MGTEARGLAFAALATIAAAAVASGAERSAIAGAVRDLAGKPVEAAQVRACADERKVCVTAYSSADGTYRLENLWTGSYDLTVEKSGFESVSRGQIALRSGRTRTLPLTMRAGAGRSLKADPDYLRELPEGQGKALIRSVCIQCHGISDRMVAQGKRREEWQVTVDNMLAKIAPLPAGQRETIVDYLAEHFSPAKVAALAKEHADAADQAYATRGVSFIEYAMPPNADAAYDPTTGTTLTTHDVRVDQQGNVWISEMARDALVKLDPRTATFEQYPIPYKSSGPHGVIVAPDGAVWISLIWADRLMKFDPQKEAFTVDVKIPEPQSWPHTVALDSRGNLWFTEMYGNAIGMFDPRAGRFERHPVPTPRATPYGIAIDGDDNVWFTGITYHKIGRIDARSREIREYPTPTALSATRKLAVDRQGNVWCSEFGAGKLARLEPGSGRITEYPLPAEYSSPYDVTVDRDGRVWFPDFTGNKIIAFDPQAEQFTEFRIPTPFSRPRIIDPDPSGGVWFSQSEVGKVGRLQLR